MAGPGRSKSTLAYVVPSDSPSQCPVVVNLSQGDGLSPLHPLVFYILLLVGQLGL